MKNVVVVTAGALSQRDVKRLVVSMGGYWNKETDQGVIERNDAAVFVAYSCDVSVEYEPEEVVFLQGQLGGEPTALVDIHISGREGSSELAQEVCEHLLQKWGGYLDDTIEELSSP